MESGIVNTGTILPRFRARLIRHLGGSKSLPKGHRDEITDVLKTLAVSGALNERKHSLRCIDLMLSTQLSSETRGVLKNVRDQIINQSVHETTGTETKQRASAGR